jgi:hypothetical protein
VYAALRQDGCPTVGRFSAAIEGDYSTSYASRKKNLCNYGIRYFVFYNKFFIYPQLLHFFGQSISRSNVAQLHTIANSSIRIDGGANPFYIFTPSPFFLARYLHSLLFLIVVYSPFSFVWAL